MYGYLLATLVSTSLARSASVAATNEATGDLSLVHADLFAARLAAAKDKLAALLALPDVV